MSGKSLSIIIPVRDDVRIYSLLKQIDSQYSEDVELIIVANGSTEEFSAGLGNFLPPEHSCRLLVIPQGDIAMARNAGVKHAAGEFLLFLDSDCILTPQYLLRLLEYLHNKLGAPLIARGPVSFRARGGVFSELNCRMRERSYLRHKKTCYAPNLVVASSVFRVVGGFYEGIGYGVDTEWGRRAELAGFTINFLPPESVIVHEDDAASAKTMITWFRYGVGRAFRERRNFLLGKHTLPSYMISLFPRSDLVDGGDSLIYLLFVGLHYIVRTAGVLYGSIIKWKHLRREDVTGLQRVI